MPPPRKESSAAPLMLAVGNKAVGLVGKGIVYDTGGLALKPREGMCGMKGDCGGAPLPPPSPPSFSPPIPTKNTEGPRRVWWGAKGLDEQKKHTDQPVAEIQTEKMSHGKKLLEMEAKR